MAQELAAIVVIAGAMILFAFVGFSMKESKWIRDLFFIFSLLMVPVLLFVGMIVADINGLTALESILERTYSAFVIVYFFLVAIFVIKFVIFLFNMFKLKKENDIHGEID